MNKREPEWLKRLTGAILGTAFMPFYLYVSIEVFTNETIAPTFLGRFIITAGCVVLFFVIIKSAVEAYEVYRLEKGYAEKGIFVKLVATEWVKAFVIGVASSICASLVLLLFSS